jgi:hypothetical protein
MSKGINVFLSVLGLRPSAVAPQPLFMAMTPSKLLVSKVRRVQTFVNTTNGRVFHEKAQRHKNDKKPL